MHLLLCACALLALADANGAAPATSTPPASATSTPPATGATEPAAPPTVAAPRPLSLLTPQERASLPRPELDALFRATPVADLLSLARSSLESLGTYTVRMTSQERVRGELLEQQTVQLTTRTRPMAALLRYVEGPAKGRVVLYDETLRKRELRVRETGFKGLIGALWISLDSSVVHGDTTHGVDEAGYGPLVGKLDRDFERSAPFGGHLRTDEGFDAVGAFCMLYVAPAKATGLYADSTRLCVDPAQGLPARVEVSNRGLLIERFIYQGLRANLTGEEAEITLEAAGL